MTSELNENVKIKIKTLIDEWFGQTLLFCRHSEGPVVEFSKDDVMAIESQTSSFVPDESLNLYIYRKNGSTLTVRYVDLREAAPDLAKKGKESLARKIHAPDPCMGSCT